MRVLAAIVLTLAVLGASTQCVADCLTPPATPPCHQDSAPEPCNHAQLAVLEQAICPQAVETPALAEAAFEPLTPGTSLPGSARPSFNVLRI